MSATTADTSRRRRPGGLSSSQAALRGLLVVAATALAGLTLAAAPDPVLLTSLVLVAVAVWAALRPESAGATVLVAGLALNWVATVHVPDTTLAWVQLLVGALLLLVVHLCAALAASLPPGAAVPGVSLRRWARRGAVVAAATVPVWALSYGAASQVAPGEVSLTYAAIVAVAGLALAVWLLSRERRG